MLIIAAYDSVQPSIGLRGGSRNDVPSSSSSIKIEPVLPKLIIPDEPKPQTNEKQDCGNYNEDSCNSKQDALGNVCHWCTKANDRVCVSAKSTNYMFAPCNSWICHDERGTVVRVILQRVKECDENEHIKQHILYLEDEWLAVSWV